MTERAKAALNDILEAIGMIEVWARIGRAAFDQSAMLQSAVVYKLLVIGEAVGRISDELTARQPQIEWHPIKRFRNIAAHDYSNVDLNIVWQIVEHDLPPLRQAVSALAQS